MLAARRSWTIGLAFLLALPASSCAPVTSTRNAAPAAGAAETTELDSYTIPRLPDWTERTSTAAASSMVAAAAGPGPDVRYFRIPKLMKDFGLSRLEAIEIQKHYRDFTAQGAAGPEAFTRAVREVKAGRLGSGISPSRLRAAPFIVVYDLDETLYQAYYHSGARGPEWRDIRFESRGEEGHIKLRPGWERALLRVRELGGLVMIFTARSDDVMEVVAKNWRLGETPIRQLVDGFFTKSHLVLQEKSDGEPVLVPAKDLRMLDESLERVIIVDDNPKRILQPHRHRLIKKFHADPYLEVTNSPQKSSVVTTSFEGTLPMVVRELEETVAYQRAHAGSSFAAAYLPYTATGQLAMEALVTTGMTVDQARDYIRTHPTYVDAAF